MIGFPVRCCITLCAQNITFYEAIDYGWFCFRATESRLFNDCSDRPSGRGQPRGGASIHEDIEVHGSPGPSD